jgi:hypothetical protein
MFYTRFMEKRLIIGRSVNENGGEIGLRVVRISNKDDTNEKRKSKPVCGACDE